MNKLIVLVALATLFGPAIGCSLLNKRNVPSCQSCEPAPAPGLLGGLRLPKISLPWRRSADLTQECNSCNEGFSEVGIGNGGFVTEGYSDGGFVDYGSASTSGLYDANTVYSGPAAIGSSSVASPTSVSAPMGSYASELIPTPLSPELGSRN